MSDECLHKFGELKGNLVEQLQSYAKIEVLKHKCSDHLDNKVCSLLNRVLSAENEAIGNTNRNIREFIEQCIVK